MAVTCATMLGVLFRYAVLSGLSATAQSSLLAGFPAFDFRNVNVLSWSIRPFAGGRDRLEFNIAYRVATVAIPFAVLFAGGFLLDPYQSSLYQLDEPAASSYEFCGGGLAEHNLVSVEH